MEIKIFPRLDELDVVVFNFVEALFTDMFTLFQITKNKKLDLLI